MVAGTLCLFSVEAVSTSKTASQGKESLMALSAEDAIVGDSGESTPGVGRDQQSDRTTNWTHLQDTHPQYEGVQAGRQSVTLSTLDAGAGCSRPAQGGGLLALKKDVRGHYQRLATYRTFPPDLARSQATCSTARKQATDTQMTTDARGFLNAKFAKAAKITPSAKEVNAKARREQRTQSQHNASRFPHPPVCIFWASSVPSVFSCPHNLRNLRFPLAEVGQIRLDGSFEAKRYLTLTLRFRSFRNPCVPLPLSASFVAFPHRNAQHKKALPGQQNLAGGYFSRVARERIIGTHRPHRTGQDSTNRYVRRDRAQSRRNPGVSLQCGGGDKA